MADVNANIGIHIDTSQSLAEIKNLQRQLAQLYTSINKGSAAAAAAQKGLATNLMNTINAGGKFYAQMGTIRTSTESFTHALEKNKLTMREYFRFAGGSTKTFGRLFKQEFDTIGRVAEERVKKMQTQYIKLGRDASGAMKAISITPTTLNMKEYGNQVAVAAQKQALLNQLLKQGSTNLLNFGKNTQWAGRQLMVGFTIPLAYFGTAAAKTFMDLEAQALKFKRVYGDMFTTTEQTTKALADIEALAKEFTKYGVAVTKTMEMAASAAAMGKTGAELTAQVAQATRLAVLGNVEQQQALDTTISLTNAFGLAAEDLAGKINFLNAVENQTITAIEDLTIAIPKAGPVVQGLGGSVEDLAFFLTAMREGGINASEGANALKSGLASLINPTDKAKEMLAGFGINIDAIVEGNIGNIRETVIDFAQALDQLAPIERSRAIEQLFGKFQFARLDALFTNVTKEGGQAAKVLELAGKSVEELAILSERELKAVEDAVGTNFRAAVEELKLAIAPIGKEFLKAITPVVKFFGDLFEKFNNLSDGSKKFIVILTTLIGLVGPTLLMTFGLVANGAANIIKLFLLMRQGFLKLTGNSTNLAQQTQYLNTEQQEAAVVAASLNQAHTKLTQQFTLEASAVNQLRNAYVSATAAAARFAAANPGMMMPGFRGIKGGGTQKFADGTVEVLGGEPGKDSVLSLLTPGEAVIPAGIAQDDRFKPIVEALVTGKIPGYNLGTASVGDEPGSIRFNGRTFRATTQKTAFDLINKINSDIELAKQPGGVGEEVARRVIANRMQSLQDRGELLTKSRVFKHIVGGVTTSGGSRANNPAIAPLRSAINKQYAQASDKELRTLQQRLKDAGLNDTQVKDFVKKTEAHILDPANKTMKWTSGQVLDDYFGLNNYLNRAGGQSISSALTAVAGDVNKYRGLGYSEKEIRQLIYDHEFAKSKKHPTSYKELQSLGRIADFEKRLLASPVMGQLDAATRSDFLKQRHQAIGVSALLSVREPGFYKNLSRRLIQLGSGTASRVLRGQEERLSRQERRGIAQRVASRLPFIVGRGETVRTQDARGRVTDTTVTGQTGRPKPPGMRAIGGGPSDRRVISGSNITSIFPRGFRGPRAVGIGAQGGFNETSMGIKSGGAPRTAQSKQRVIQQNIDSVEDDTKQNKALTDQKKTFGQKLNTGVNVFSGLTIMGSFMGGKIGEISQKLAPLAIGLSTISMLLPGLKAGILKFGAFLAANPFVAVGLAIAGIAVAAKIVDEKMKKQARAQSDYIDTISATTEKMKKVGEITGEVGASQIMQKRREGATADKFVTGYDRAGQQFGTSFLESEVGKEILGNFQNNLAKGGSSAVKQIALELSSYVSDGLMTAEDANSVARSIGINMSDMALAANIQGEIRSIIGPDGQDLVTDPLKVRLEIVEASRQNIQDYATALSKELSKIGAGGEAYDVGFARDMAAAGAASSVQALEAIQAQRDAQAKLVDDKIRDLELEKSKTKDKQKQAQIEQEISSLREQQAQDDKTLSAERSKIIKDQLVLFKESQKVARGETAFFEAAKQQVKTKFESDPFTEKFIQTAADLKSKEIEVQLLTVVGAGDLSPRAAINFIELFKGNEAKLNTVINSKIALENPDKFAQLQNIAGGLTGKGSKKVGLDIITTLTAPGEESKFDDRLSALTLLQKMDGKEINLAAFLKGNVKKNLDELVPLLNKVEGKKTITIEVLEDLKGETGVDMSGLINDWDHYVNLPDDVKKTVTQTYIAIYKSIGDKEASEFIASQIEAAGGSTLPQNVQDSIRSKYMNTDGTYNLPAITAELTKPQFAPGKAPGQIPGGTTPGDEDKKQRDTTLDNLLTRLKFIRKASIDAEKGVGELMRITSGKGLTNFGGVMQQLMQGPKGGFNREFISFLEQMDNKTRATYMTIKNGEVILTKQGKALKEAFNEKVIGEYQVAQYQAIQDAKAQESAFIKLKAAGVDTAQALEMVSDANLAVAINGKKISSKELKQMADDAKRAADAQELFNLKLEASKSAENLKTLEKTAKVLKAISTTPGISKEALSRVAQSPVLMERLYKQIFEGAKKGAAEINQLLNDAAKERTANFRVQVNVDPSAAIQGAIDAALGPAMSSMQAVVNAQTRKISAPFLTQIAGKKRQIASIQGSQEYIDTQKAIALQQSKITQQQGVVNRLNTQVSAIDQQISDIQNQIQEALTNATKAIDEKIDKANEEVATLKRAVELEFDKPIQDLQRQIDAIEKSIEYTFTQRIDDLNESLNDLQRQIDIQFGRPIEVLQRESKGLSNELQDINDIAEKINEKYDIQQQELQKVADLNEKIANSQKQQLDLADAITKGDASAAARAMQEMRAQSAKDAAAAQGEILDAAKNAEIRNLRSKTGRTRKQIEERQKQIDAEVRSIEAAQERFETEKNILGIKDQIYNLEEARKDQQLKIRDFQKQIDDLEAKRLPRLIAIENKERDILLLEAEREAAIANVQKTVKDLESQINALEGKKSSLAKDIASAQKALSELETDKTYLANQAKIDDMNKTIADLQADIDALEAEMAAAIANDKTLQGIIDKMNEAEDAIASAYLEAFTKTGQFATDLQTIANAAKIAAEAVAEIFSASEDASGSTVTGTKVIDSRTAITSTNKTGAAKKGNATAEGIGKIATELGKAKEPAKAVAESTKNIKDNTDKFEPKLKSVTEYISSQAEKMPTIKDAFAAIADIIKNINIKPYSDGIAVANNNTLSNETLWGRIKTAISNAISSLDSFIAKLISAFSQTQSLVNSLNTTVVTNHVIRTIYETVGTPPVGTVPNAAGKMYGGKIQGFMGGGKVKPVYRPMGGLIPYMANGGFKPMGSDTVPAMLTPGEFVVNRASTQAFMPLLSAINDSKFPSSIAGKMFDTSGDIRVTRSFNTPEYNIMAPSSASFVQPIYSVNNLNSVMAPVNNASSAFSDNSSTVYNYSVGISVGGTNADPKNIAKAVINEIKYIDSQRIRTQRA